MDKNQQVEEQKHFQRNKNRLQDRHTFCESAQKTGVTEYSSEYARGNGNNEVRATLKAAQSRRSKDEIRPAATARQRGEKKSECQRPNKSYERLEKTLAYQG